MDPWLDQSSDTSIVSFKMKTHNSWMKKNIKKFWTYVAYSQISIFSTKETKPKLAKEELICQARTSRDQIHGQTFFFEISEPRFQIGFPVIFDGYFVVSVIMLFHEKKFAKIKLFRRFQLDIFLVSHLSHFIKAVSGAFFFVKSHLNDDDLVTMTSSL